MDELRDDQVFLDDVDDDACDCFDCRAAFLDDGRVIANTRQQRLLLTTDPLAVQAELWPDGLGITAYGGRGQLVDKCVALGFARDIRNWSVTRGRLLTTHSGGRRCLWGLASIDQGGSV